jgi:hypothetical protein
VLFVFSAVCGFEMPVSEQKSAAELESELGFEQGWSIEHPRDEEEMISMISEELPTEYEYGEKIEMERAGIADLEANISVQSYLGKPIDREIGEEERRKIKRILEKYNFNSEFNHYYVGFH